MARTHAFDPWFHLLLRGPTPDYIGDPPPRIEAEFLARLFEQSGVLFREHSDNAVAQCLNTIINPSESDTFFAILDDEVDQEMRERVVAAMFRVFRDVMAPRCAPLLGHLGEEGGNTRLNSICYMWWDVIPLYSRSGDAAREALDPLVLRVMERTLDLKSVACQESALHGLGHWAVDYDTTVQPIVDRFLSDGHALRPELRAYAEGARVGGVL